jgi:predicted GNAT family acetyltransferase
MNVTLSRAALADAQELWQMQKEAFQSLLDKYQDFDLSPACEPLEKVIMRLEQPISAMYFILADGVKVGALRVRTLDDGFKKLGPIWVMPSQRNRGIAQQAIRLAEDIYDADHWILDTILQEPGNCHLYEKLGYRRTGELRPVNDKLTLVFYEK